MDKNQTDESLGGLRKFFSDDLKSLLLDTLQPLPVSLTEFPTGWTSAWELTLLYNFARYAPGTVRILEIGPWLGRSTTAICLGLRDRRDQETAVFDVVDFGITSGTEWEALLKVSFLDFAGQDQVCRGIYTQGGSLAVLIENLRRLGLLNHITSLIRGNCLQVPLRDAYDVIFCDTLHDSREIELYGRLLCDKLTPGGLLVCDDVIDATLGDVLARYVPFEFLIYLNRHDPMSTADICVGQKRIDRVPT